MRKLGKMTFSTIITIMLVLVTAFCISGTVISQSKGASKVEAEYFGQMEQDYVKEVRAFLSEKGYTDSGVTMTRVIEDDGTREYLVTIHHRRISKLDQAAQANLKKECQNISFPAENCKLYHEFLQTDL